MSLDLATFALVVRALADVEEASLAAPDSENALITVEKEYRNFTNPSANGCSQSRGR